MAFSSQSVYSSKDSVHKIKKHTTTTTDNIAKKTSQPFQPERKKPRLDRFS